MRLIFSIVLTAVLAYVLGILGDWYSIFLAAFVTGIAAKNNALNSFLAGFLGIGLLWAGLALFADIRNEHILSTRMSSLIFGSANSFLLILVTALLGAVVGGLSAWSGFLLRRTKKPRYQAYGK
jgi:Na+/phosphate symporter